MPKYEVVVRRQAEYGWITVEAENEDNAQEKALYKVLETGTFESCDFIKGGDYDVESVTPEALATAGAETK